ncbi:class I SAM-dependent methyltransferase [Rhodobacteraceae bacterium XHP0102]|nr:class I SAM-dependent methyltransferase [Rhodobacteraceae bacterium XHP0102]
MTQFKTPRADQGTPPDAASELTRAITARLRAHLDGPPRQAALEAALRDLAKWRVALLDATHRRHMGADTRVLSGPFVGMAYATAATEGAGLSRRLGAYEASLHPIIERIIARGYARVIDIGCAEGYYAVGLARRMPKTEVLARDSNPEAQHRCAELARVNGVAARVKLGGAVDAAFLDAQITRDTVLICDIEGGEEALLDPARHPALRSCDILVEVHECWHRGLTEAIRARFAPTHKVQQINRSLAPEALPAWMEHLSDLDRALALWEWRMGPTPWLWMTQHG